MADDLEDTLATLESYLSTQMFKAVATLKANNVTKRSKGMGRSRRHLVFHFMGVPLWCVLQRPVAASRQKGASAYLCRNIQFGIYEPPYLPFVPGKGVELGDTPQSIEDL